MLFVLTLYSLAINCPQMTSKIYERFMSKILNAPIDFFNSETTNTLSHIFNQDLVAFDMQLPSALNLSAFSFVYIAVILLISMVVNPLVLIFTLSIGSILLCFIVSFS